MERKFEKRDLSGLMNNSDQAQQERDSSPNPRGAQRGTLQTATGQYKLQTTQDQKTDYNWDEEDNWEPQSNDSAAAAPWAPKQTAKVDLQSAITNLKPTTLAPQRDGLERFRTHKIERMAPAAAPSEEWKRRGSSGTSQGLRPLGRFAAAAGASGTPALAARPAASTPAAAPAPAEPAVSAEETIAAQKRAMAEARERAAAARAAELEKEEQEKAARLAARLAELERKIQPPAPVAPSSSHKWERRQQHQQQPAPQPAAVDQDWGAAKKKGKGPLQSMRRQKEERGERSERSTREQAREPKREPEQHDDNDNEDEHEQPHLETHLQKVVVKLPKYKTACNPKEILADLAHRAPQFAPEQKSNLPVRIQLPKCA